MTVTRRGFFGSAALAQAQAQRPARVKTWKPKLGILGRYAESNIRFAQTEGLQGLGLWADPKTSLDALAVTDAQVEQVRTVVASSGLALTVLGSVQNHIAPDPEARTRANTYFGKVIELAAKLGVPHVSTSSGTMPGRPLDEQAAEIVRVYETNYFPLCQKHRIRILWEPWAGGPNIATGPPGYDALFRAFANSPHVGLEYDPSHLVWQMMDPVQCARDYVDKIYSVHLKDTEIRWPILRRVGINPPNNVRWWRFRLPGMGSVDWASFFTVLMDAGYEGSMNIEHEDPLYGWPYPGNEFSEEYRAGITMAHRFLRQFIP